MRNRALVQRVDAPQWEPHKRIRTVEPLALLIAAATVPALFALFSLKLRGLAFAGVSLGFSAVVAYLVFRTNRRVNEFDAALVPLLQREDIPKIEQLFADSPLVRHLGPRGFLASRRGVVALLKDDAIEAERQLEIAWQRTAIEARAGLVAPLCRTKFRTKKLMDMRELAEDWVRIQPKDSPALWYLALGKLESEGIASEDLDDLVVRAGAPEEPVDRDVQRLVFAHMAARDSGIGDSPTSDSQPESTQPSLVPADFGPETGAFAYQSKATEQE